MEGNKDEANRCIEIALTSIRLGNTDKAFKMLEKAQRLFPTKRAEALLREIQSGKYSKQEDDVPEDSAQPRRRKTAGHSTDSTGGSATEATYTTDQVTLVNKVLKCKDFYEVLSVCKESTDAEIKKAYKKLALKLHPDKNTAPGAVEAFKKVGNAVSILTDTEKRKHYDLYGPEESVSHSHRGSGGGRRQTNNFYSDYYDYDYSAEDVFNMYFSGFHNPHMHQRRYRRQFDTEYRAGEGGGGDHQQMTFGLILMIIVVLSMTSFFRSDPVYSLSPTSDYSVTRHTSGLQVPYYVKPNFDTEYQGPMARLELSIEEQYVGHMKQQCYRERHYRDMMMARARSFGNKAQFAQAQEMKTPSCDNLYRMGKYQY